MMPLGSIPDWLLNSMLGPDEAASFQDQQGRETRTHHPQLRDNRSVNIQGASSSTSCGIPRSVDCYNDLAYELEKQRVEMDWLLEMENQKLRTAVQETSRQHALLLRKYESKIMDLISQKDKDLELARSRNMELQNFLVRAQEENQALQKKAMEGEAMVLDLSSKFEKAIEGNLMATFNGAHDAESYCESSKRARSREQEPQQLKKRMVCKQCKGGSLNVVFLPCQHLCSCTSCEPFLALCPMCQAGKEGSLEVFFD